MTKQIEIEGFEGQRIELKPAGFLSGVKLLVNGEPAPKGPKRGQMLLQRNDGKQVIASWKPQVLGLDVPQLIVDGKVNSIVEPLKWYKWVWGGWPVILVFLGGALGALAGIISFSINTKIFRTEMNDALKYVITAVVSVLAVAAYIGIALIITFFIES